MEGCVRTHGRKSGGMGFQLWDEQRLWGTQQGGAGKAGKRLIDPDTLDVTGGVGSGNEASLCGFLGIILACDHQGGVALLVSRVDRDLPLLKHLTTTAGRESHTALVLGF